VFLTKDSRTVLDQLSNLITGSAVYWTLNALRSYCLFYLCSKIVYSEHYRHSGRICSVPASGISGGAPVQVHLQKAGLRGGNKDEVLYMPAARIYSTSLPGNPGMHIGQ
jgi:hypothetical protein